jgi:DNA-directed RNA polymerase alpha subunit
MYVCMLLKAHILGLVDFKVPKDETSTANCPYAYILNKMVQHDQSCTCEVASSNLTWQKHELDRVNGLEHAAMA